MDFLFWWTDGLWCKLFYKLLFYVTVKNTIFVFLLFYLRHLIFYYFIFFVFGGFTWRSVLIVLIFCYSYKFSNLSIYYLRFWTSLYTFLVAFLNFYWTFIIAPSDFMLYIRTFLYLDYQSCIWCYKFLYTLKYIALLFLSVSTWLLSLLF